MASISEFKEAIAGQLAEKHLTVESWSGATRRSSNLLEINTKPMPTMLYEKISNSKPGFWGLTKNQLDRLNKNQILWFAVFALMTLWRSQIDIGATFSQWMTPAAPFVAINPNSIYQNGQEVGNVVGDVLIQENRVTFQRITDTGNLNRDEPFEYQRERLRIVEMGSTATVRITNQGLLQNDMKDVVCERVP